MTNLTNATGFREAKAWAIRHASELEPLLNSDRALSRSELPEETQLMLPRGSFNGAIEQVRREEGEHGLIYYYRIHPKIQGLVLDHLKHADTLPCGHTGLQNLRDGGYSCGVEVCDAEYSRETVEEVFK